MKTPSRMAMKIEGLSPAARILETKMPEAGDMYKSKKKNQKTGRNVKATRLNMNV